MYFPYVYGRQAEMLALREAANTYLPSGIVIPIIEPVLENPRPLEICLETLGKKELSVVVVVNPFQNEFKKGYSAHWVTQIDAVINKYPSLLPAFCCHQNVTAAQIQAFLKKFSGRDVVLLYLNCSLTDAEVQRLAAVNNIKYHICLQDKITAAHHSLIPNAKRVEVTDNFNKQMRNADYGGAEHFTDNHKTFNKASVGFGDYTVVGCDMAVGGGPPGAVVIHATFKNKKNNDIWVEHFVSDETDVAMGSPASKYLEAVEKLYTAHPPRVNEFGTNFALASYFSDYMGGHFPGLTKNKERQIYHHIALMHDVLMGVL